MNTDQLTPVFSERSATVTDFDDHVGAGTATEDDGTAWWFHCTAIGDGSRQVEPGRRVRIEIGPGPTGIEARLVHPI